MSVYFETGSHNAALASLKLPTQRPTITQKNQSECSSCPLKVDHLTKNFPVYSFYFFPLGTDSLLKLSDLSLPNSYVQDIQLEEF